MDLGIVANVTIQPTCTFTNALPFPASVTLFEAWYGRPSSQLRNAPAHTNKPTLASKVKHASVMADAWSMGLPEEEHHATALLGPTSPIHNNVCPPSLYSLLPESGSLVHAHVTSLHLFIAVRAQHRPCL